MQSILFIVRRSKPIAEDAQTPLSPTHRSLTKERELWSSERSRMAAEQERLLSERDKAIGECDRLLAKTASASSEQNELVQQRRELLAEREQLLAQHQAMQTEHEKVCVDVCMYTACHQGDMYKWLRIDRSHYHVIVKLVILWLG